MATARTSGPSIALALWILATVATLFFLRAASILLIPIILSILISYALEPIVAWLDDHRIPRPAGASLLMLVILALSSWGLYSLKDDVIEVTSALPQAARQARDLISSQGGTGPAANIREAANVLQGRAGNDQASAPQNASGVAGTSGARRSASQSDDPVKSATEGQQGSTNDASGAPGGTAIGSDMGTLVQRGVGSILSLAGNVVVVLFLVFFMLLSGNHFRKRLIEIAGPELERRKVTAQIIDDINAQVQRFLLVRLFTAVAVGVLTWAALTWMEVEQAAVWGILAGVFNSIPYFGPVIVSGGLLVVGLIQTGEMIEAVKISGVALAITSLEGWLLTPPLIGKAERMNVVVVFLGLLLWSWLWGAWGTILAVPMLVVLKSVADHVESLKPVGRLMSP